MTRSFEVRLSETRVGWLRDEPDGRIGFRFHKSYVERSERPVLGQHFEDDLERVYVGRDPGRLPRFFWNLLPEGAFRSVVEGSFSPRPADDLELLVALGHDLPGATIVVASDEPFDPAPAAVTEEARPEPLEGRFGFSLAGAQLKFSLLKDRDRFVLPARDQRGDWILKAPTTNAYPGLVENEWAMLEWARRAGFEVPEHEIVEWPALASIHPYLVPGTRALGIRRFDRVPGGRIHQEDFAQVLDVPPVPSRQKFQSSAIQLAENVGLILGHDGYLELLRRTAFVIASGNNDAHLKNWSLVYRDGVTPSWSPLYDQIFTGAWKEFRPGALALGLPGPKEFGNLRLGAFQALAERLKKPSEEAASVVTDTLARLRAALPSVLEQGVLSKETQHELAEHWARTPLLRGE